MALPKEDLYTYKQREHLMNIHWVSLIQLGMGFDMVSECQADDVRDQIVQYVNLNLHCLNANTSNMAKIEFHHDEVMYILNESLEYIAKQRKDYRVRFYHIFPWRRPLKLFQANLDVLEAFCIDLRNRLGGKEGEYKRGKLAKKETHYPQTFLVGERYYCMSHLGWTTTDHRGLCSNCGSAMLSTTDET